ncbi:peptide-methionine (R)-S-oxide reductase MsrB [Peptostreptococcus russellii]|uniref:Peptide methionine sulfoxide reductase MsrA n=1 Tax=Peptostreptococcus russellii TaxID=215200 RepID=A0A1H8F6I5_9FIRM|nr:peptide-methionine (R)-S-oxide reductase MsrB [Peptostreptococcus russellii]SEN27322.1 peptide methionine sulfoxide reductase msrA/msrB [Peptostreptococcus russellii]
MKKLATFAGGCFWCMVKPFTAYEGVFDVISGYTGGEKENPTYEDICSGRTGHYEAIEISYDDEYISYNDLLKIYWKQINPYDDGGQFSDRGSQYESAIFYHDLDQKREAEESKKALEELSGKKVYTEIVEAGKFYPAEEYHQDYYKKNQNHYNLYYKNSGRQKFLKENWDKNNFSREKLRKKLTNIQFEVTQNDMTEVPFENEYYNNFEKGIYVDVVDGTPLFSSSDKFDSGCGWPAFGKTIEEACVYYRSDYSFGRMRTEVRSVNANSHLGHVFLDGPDKFAKRRYCINSASLKFIQYDKMEEYGYGEYKKYVK